MMYTHTLLALLCAALAGGSAWQVQSWRYGAKELKNENKTLAAQATAQDLSRAILQRQANNFAVASNASTVRATALRRDADSAHDALERLRRATASSALPNCTTGTDDARIDRATALSELLNACAERYQHVAEKAGRHASDTQTLTEAWPKE